MRIFVSGFSGVGKTRFVKRLYNHFGKIIPIVSEVIRDSIENHPNIESMSFEEKQDIYYQKYLEVHANPNTFICDRSIVDVIIWTHSKNDVDRKRGIQEAKKQLKLDLKRVNAIDPTIVLIPPVPSFADMWESKSNWLGDPVRINAYQERLGFKENPLKNSSNIAHFLQRIHESFKKDSLELKRFYRFLGWNYSELMPDYYSWQESGIDFVHSIIRKKVQSYEYETSQKSS